MEAADAQSRTQDIWLLGLARGVVSRLTFDPRNDTYPVWSPDGSRIAFGSDREGGFNLYQKLSNGAAGEELLLKSSSDAIVAPYSWSPDGRFLFYRDVSSGGFNTGILPLIGDRKPRLFFPKATFAQVLAQVSPDGRWIAYSSNESGRYEMYVQSFPTPGGKWQISKDGGFHQRWRGDGKELFYHAADGQLMAVPIAGDSALEIGTAVPLFKARLLNGPVIATGFRAQYDVARDGQRFLLNVPLEETQASTITVVVNWTAGLKK